MHLHLRHPNCSYASLAILFYLVLSQEQVFNRLHEVTLKNQSSFLGRGSAHTQHPWEALSWGQLDTLYHPCLCLQPGVGIRAARNIPLQGWDGHSCLESCRAVEERVTEELLGSASESPHTQRDACFRQTDRCAVCAPKDSVKHYTMAPARPPVPSSMVKGHQWIVSSDQGRRCSNAGQNRSSSVSKHRKGFLCVLIFLTLLKLSRAKMELSSWA